MTAETREQALLRAFEMRWPLEEGDDDGAVAELERMAADAERRGWSEVVRACMYAGISRHDRVAFPPYDAGGLVSDPLDAAVEALRARAEADGDPTMLAAALSYRVMAWLATHDPSAAVSVDRALAHATVLLEEGAGSALERVVGHNRCAIALGERGLWELADEQYEAAEALLNDCGETLYGPAVRFNRAELKLDWASSLREIGDCDALDKIAVAGLAEVEDARADPRMPEQWLFELDVVGMLLSALVGEDRSAEARAVLSRPLPSPVYEGHVHLAVALAFPEVPAAEALAAAERAIELIDPVRFRPGHDLALRISAEIESATAGRPTAGLRYGQRQVGQRWGARLSTLAAVQSLVHTERLRAERDMLRREAYIDDLTRLSNRRGYQSWISGLEARGIEQIAMLVLDVDHFKQVNDRYGHAVGDSTLTQLGRILAGSARPSDLAARLGGDEFALLLADADLEAARARATELLEELWAHEWSSVHPELHVSVCIGATAGPVGDIADLALRADTALYEAKAAGGGRCVVR